MLNLVGRIVLACMLFSGPVWAACTGSSPTWTSTPDRTSVASCVSSATYGDTINVSAASETTWTSQLVITKNVKLIGPGAGSLTIKAGFTSTNGTVATDANFLILYTPDATTRAADGEFRISGFTFNMDSRCMLFKAKNTTSTFMTQTRFDNCIVNNTTGRTLAIEGNIGGVIYKNIFNATYLVMSIYGNNSNWQYLTHSPGNQYNIFFEDNVVTTSDTPHDAGLGCNGVIRYNTYTANDGVYPWIDFHGNQASAGNTATMGSEVYGNNITVTNNDGSWIDLRGGQGIVYYNNMNTSSSDVKVYAMEEYNDNLEDYPTASDGQPQHVSESYMFTNFRNNTTYINPTITTTVDYGGEIGIVPQFNIDVWRQYGTYSGESGVGCGPLGSRPATCTEGTAYWATDQSCTNMTGLVGASTDVTGGTRTPTTYLTGILYICGSSNWTNATTYTPYTYPHPLRGEVAVPTSATNLRMTNTGLR